MAQRKPVVTVKFGSDTNFSVFTDRLGYYHPNDQAVEDPAKLTVQFLTEPSTYVRGLGSDLGGDWK